MKLASFKNNHSQSYGVVIDNGIIAASQDFRNRFPSLRDVLEAGGLSDLASDTHNRKIDISLDNVDWQPPITNPSRISVPRGM